jgi:hypothetical protein
MFILKRRSETGGEGGEAADFNTVSAADALWAVWSEGGVDAHLADAGTDPASNTVSFLQPDLVKGNFIEKAINRAQGTEDPAKKTIDQNTPQNGPQGNRRLQ